MKKNTERIRNIVLTVLAAIIGLIFSFPLLWMTMQSFQSDSEAIYALPPVLPEKLDFSSYQYIFENWDILHLLGNTLTIVVSVCILTIISSTLVGYGFARIQARGKNLMFSVLLGTVMLPFVVTLVPSYAIWARLGLLGTYVPLILPSIGGGAFNIFLVRMFVMGIPRTLDEAAEIDGCGRLQTLFRVIIPQLGPVLATIVLFTFIGVWGDYVSPSLYLWGHTDMYTLSIKLATSFKSEFGTMDWPKVMAGCVVVSIPIVAVILRFQNAFVRGVVTSGLKE